MNEYIDNGFRAIIKPKKPIDLAGYYLIPEIEYHINKQEEPVNIPNGLKRTLIQGRGMAIWFGYPIEEHFDIVEVLRERTI